MSDLRAVLMRTGPFGVEFVNGAKSATAAFAETANQSLWKYCVDHQTPVARLAHPDAWLHLDGAEEYVVGKCHIVNAFLVPLPEGEA